MAKTYNFGEKKTEFNAKLGKECEVWQSPKYLEAKRKAIEALNSDMYKDVLSESDFWILMNATKSGKMAYTGLIISHNGCLKINDVLPAEKRFKPSCMKLDKDGYNGSLVFSYINDEQGVYEVGEVSAKNCTNTYPYAMALKRCMDRVILKISKLAYAGIYSDSEAEEFKNEPKEEAEPEKLTCDVCKNEITKFTDKKGIERFPEAIALETKNKFGKVLCAKCAHDAVVKAKKAKEEKMKIDEQAGLPFPVEDQ